MSQINEDNLLLYFLLINIVYGKVFFNFFLINISVPVCEFLIDLL